MKLLTDILRDYRKGDLVEQASVDFQDVVRSVLETGKKASLTITLTVLPNKNDTSLVFVEGDIKGKPAKAPMPAAIFYADSTGDLHRSDPKQADIFNEADGVERRVLHNAPKG